jgi:SAM-dependent methyltransferase
MRSSSLVLEVASNDGYLLQFFKAHGIGVLGVEPAANVAEAAKAKGIATDVSFFGTETARRLTSEGKRADLIAANNVLAHVPDLNDFVAGFKIVLKPSGTATFEFPHLLRLIEGRQFDTIYHEHFSYFSLAVAEQIFAYHRLRAFDVELLPTHGGSLRIYVCHNENARQRTDRFDAVIALERAAGLDRLEGYAGFANAVIDVKCELLSFLIDARREGKTVVGYGAAAKGNMLLNYAGVGPEFVRYVVDRNPHKHDCYLPGVQIPVCKIERIFTTKPDYVLILPWNLQEEVTEQMAGIRQWGGASSSPYHD